MSPPLGNTGRIAPDVAEEGSVPDPTVGASGTREGGPQPSWILGLLACPVDRASVRLDANELVCDRCGRRYPVVSGVPRMIGNGAEGEQKF